MRIGAGSVVVVSDDHLSRAFLREIFSENGWQVLEMGAISDFRNTLHPDWSGVILTRESLADGTWRDVRAHAESAWPQAQVVVTSRFADEFLWAAVLNEGGFDLLTEPLDRDEVIRVTTSAWQRTTGRVQRATA